MSQTLRRFSAVALFVTMVVSVATMWSTSKWATTIPEVATCGLAAMWAAAFFADIYKPRLNILLLPLCGVVLWAVLQILFGISVYKFQSWAAILYWTGNAATFFVGLQTFAIEKLREGFLRALVLFGFVVSIVSALQALTPNGKIFWAFHTVFAGGNLLGPFVYHNQFAAFVELILPIALYNAVMNNRSRAIYILISATLYAAVIISASRTGFVLTTAELIVVPLLLWRKRRVPKSALAMVSAALAVMILFLGIAAGPDVLAGRFASRTPTRFGGSLSPPRSR